MANVPHGVEILPKISIAWVGCTNVTDDRQTTDDRRQTDGPSMTNSEHELEFTFAKNEERKQTSMAMNHPKATAIDHFKIHKRMHLSLLLRDQHSVIMPCTSSSSSCLSEQTRCVCYDSQTKNKAADIFRPPDIWRRPYRFCCCAFRDL